MGSGAQLLGSGSAVRKFGPRRLGASAAVPDIVEGCGFGVGARLFGASDVEFQVRGDKDFPGNRTGGTGTPVRMIKQTSG